MLLRAAPAAASHRAAVDTVATLSASLRAEHGAGARVLVDGKEAPATTPLGTLCQTPFQLTVGGAAFDVAAPAYAGAR